MLESDSAHAAEPATSAATGRARCPAPHPAPYPAPYPAQPAPCACPEDEFDPECALRDALLAQRKDPHHPERYILGKPHPSRAAQFKPFAALRGYEELIAQMIAEANEPHDFSDLEDPC